MVWMVDKFKIVHRLREPGYDLDIPIQIEVEYLVESRMVRPASIARKIRYNRPLLIKEAKTRSAEELDELIDKTVEAAIERHFTARGYTLDSG